MLKLDIFGGGPAGLFAAYFAKKANLPFKVYEASGNIGGNCQTFTYNDFRFDSGAHRFHDKDPEMTEEILQLMSDEMQEIFAPSYIFHNGKMIHFPITPTNMLSKLEVVTLVKAVYHLFTDKYGIPEVNNFRDYTYRKYGKIIADLFLSNYSEKLWGLPTDQLSINIAGSRLKELNLKTVITEVLYPNRKAKHLEGAFFYPKEGFGQITDKVAEYCGWEDIYLNSRITKIFHEGNRITAFELNDSEIVEASEVVSSLPLSIFINNMRPEPPREIIELSRSINFRHLKLIGLFLDRDQVNDAATMYFPDSKYPFTRVYEPRNRSPLMAPKGKTSLMIEVPYSFGDQIEKMSEKDLMDQVKKLMVGTGLIQEEEIIDMTIKNLPFAYPILDNTFETKVKKINQYFERFENLHHTGRSGKFVYSWTHNMMQYGRDIVEGIEEKHRTPQETPEIKN